MLTSFYTFQRTVLYRVEREWGPGHQSHPNVVCKKTCSPELGLGCIAATFMPCPSHK